MVDDVEPPPQLPVGERGYLACRQCRLVLTEKQFLLEGCGVCGTGPVSRQELPDVTTAEFANFVGLIAPEKSWIARLIGKTDCPNGVFAAEIEMHDEEQSEGDDDDDDNEEEEEAVEEGDGQGEGEGEQGSGGVPPMMTDEELLLASFDS
ncbi:Spt4 RpoE2 zinc finger [Trypanosoma vivax]|uniref:Spt4/RpoE2 zinc finger domain-containing protein n=1 Tax=Trypanosoma vivax (strain Y486) TaxID=1055687 RepID=G0U3J1_TRYVY|nr:hypothetical protein TRVL_00367 [Trypanosoma vivax]KAH8614001.1 Spt4 RpoE2 zinc finger [Trypanosoma vivax]CCC50848.1 conserved hypothetical protein [Trypanosoma vivax Y486]